MAETRAVNRALRKAYGFLAGRTEESTPEEILLVIHRLLNLLILLGWSAITQSVENWLCGLKLCGVVTSTT